MRYFYSMNDEKKIDLKQYSPQKASKKYLFRILLYILFIVGIIWMAFSLKNSGKTSPQQKPTPIEQIDNITIELPDSD